VGLHAGRADHGSGIGPGVRLRERRVTRRAAGWPLGAGGGPARPGGPRVPTPRVPARGV